MHNFFNSHLSHSLLYVDDAIVSRLPADDLFINTGEASLAML